MEYLRTYIINNPDSLNILNILGDIFIKEQRYSEIIDTYNRLLVSESNNIDFHQYIAEAYFNLKDYKNSKLFYQKITQIDSLNINAYTNLGEIAIEQNNPQEAIKLLLHAIKYNRNSVDLLYP